MRIVAFSDGHQFWDKIQLPDGDVLVFAGDACGSGKIAQYAAFVEFIKKQAPRYKAVIVVAGNHDRCVQDLGKAYVRAWLSRDAPNVHYLQDEELVVDGVKFYGSPWTPEFGGWSFALRGPTHAKNVWANIPQDTQVLITHGPAHGILDRTIYGDLAGCQELFLRICDVLPKVHIFGHIHETYGFQEVAGVKHYNVSVCTVRYSPDNPATIIDL